MLPQLGQIQPLIGTNIVNINNQPIKMVGACFINEGDKNNVIFLFPETDKGTEFVIQQFKKNDPVSIESFQHRSFGTMRFSTEGFNLFWSKHNVEAL
jgi:hypothetical protein